MERRTTLLLFTFAVALLLGVRFLAPGIASAEPLASPSIPALLIAACAAAAVALIFSALTHAAWRSLAPLMILASVAAIAGLAVTEPWLRLGLLELGALITIPLVWQSARTRSAKLVYLSVVLISAIALVASHLLLERGQADWARALLITSICVKLAAVPLFFWLLRLADELPACSPRPHHRSRRYGCLRRTLCLSASISKSVRAPDPMADASRIHIIHRRSADALRNAASSACWFSRPSRISASCFLALPP